MNGERRVAPSPNGPDRPRARLLAWKPFRKGSLRGFASIELPNGLRIIDAPVLTTNGKSWAGLPCKPQLVDGKQRIDGNGKPLYQPVIEWRSKDLRDQFSAKVSRWS